VLYRTISPTLSSLRSTAGRWQSLPYSHCVLPQAGGNPFAFSFSSLRAFCHPRLCHYVLPFLLTITLLSAEITIVRADERGIKLSYEPGEIQFQREGTKPKISFDDADPIANFGEFDLPAKIVRVGIPQTGGINIKFQVERGGIIDDIEPTTVSFIPFTPPQDTLPLDHGKKTQKIFPLAPVELGEIQLLRSVRFVTVRFNPAQYDAAKKQLTWFRRIEVEISFAVPATINPVPDQLDEIVAELLLNGSQARDWKISPTDSPKNPFQGAPFWLKITVDTSGIYRITGRELAQAGVPLNGLNSRALALWTIGEHKPNVSYPDTLLPVAILIRGDADGTFDLNDTIIFYALGADHWVDRCSLYLRNLFTAENVYWLTWTQNAGQRIKQGFGPDTTGTKILHTGLDVLHQETDLDCPARAGLLWIWRTLYKTASQAEATFSFNLDLKYPITVTRVSGRLYSETPQNELTVFFNNRPIRSFVFGVSHYPESLNFVIDTLLPTNFQGNQLQLKLKGSGEKKVHLDYVELHYRRRLSLATGQLHFWVDDTGKCQFVVIDAPTVPIVLDISNPYRPKACVDFECLGESIRFCYRIPERTVFAIATSQQLFKPKKIELKTAGKLWADNRRIDYYIITPREFLAPAQELARYRNNRIARIPNAQAQAVALEDLYDDFCFGLKEPWAIKHFLQVKRPAYALLVGDATYDYRNNLKYNQSPGVPAYEVGWGFNPESGERRTFALDAWYADLEGQGSSPDLILGRITARTPYEFKQFVQKVINYETATTGYWLRRYLLMADDEYLRYPDRPDELRFRHIEQCEGMASLAGTMLDPVKLYLTEFPFLSAKSKPAAKSELIRQLNLGALLWTFFGHGAAHSLTHEEVLTISDVPDIQNGNRLPFSFMGSCSVGRFDDTRQECIAEELVRSSSGAIACVAATTATPSGNNLVFARNLLTPLLFPAESSLTIGSCFFQAWPTDRTYHFFGDPATVLQLPKPFNLVRTVRPETLAPGTRFSVRTIIAGGAGIAEWQLFGPLWQRLYSSPVGASTSYILPGPAVARGNFRIKDGRFYCAGIFPLGLGMDTIFTGNGYYAPLSSTLKFSATVRNDSGLLGLSQDRIQFDTSAVSANDTTGPAVSFQFAGYQLSNNAVVPNKLQLTVIIDDQSGIMIAPVLDAQPVIFVNDYRTKRAIGDLLVFDDSSFSRARCLIPLTLNGPLDSIFVSVADNFLNKTLAKIVLRPVVSTVLQVESVLVYPNPVTSQAYFCFILTQPAMVNIRIFTISGKLVRDLGKINCHSGYNQIPWEGRDQNGTSLPNGIYLFTLTAENHKPPTDFQRITIRDKLMIVR